jgi:hypothetical protein
LLDVLPARHPKPQGTSDALDLESKVEERTTETLQSDELRNREAHGRLRGVAKSVAVGELPDLLNVRA